MVYDREGAGELFARQGPCKVGVDWASGFSFDS